MQNFMQGAKMTIRCLSWNHEYALLYKKPDSLINFSRIIGVTFHVTECHYSSRVRNSSYKRVTNRTNRIAFSTKVPHLRCYSPSAISFVATFPILFTCHLSLCLLDCAYFLFQILMHRKQVRDNSDVT